MRSRTGLSCMRRETEEWLRIAYEEYQSANVLIKEGLYRMVCYHAQQTVEKMLKAILTEHEVDFSRTRNLLDLKSATDALGYRADLADRPSAAVVARPSDSASAASWKEASCKEAVAHRSLRRPSALAPDHSTVLSRPTS